MTVKKYYPTRLYTVSLLMILIACTPTPSEPGTPSASSSAPTASESGVPVDTNASATPSEAPTGTASSTPGQTATTPDTAIDGTLIKNDIGSLTITANPRFLKNVGDTSQIELIAKDSQGKTLDISTLQLSWSSTRPEDFSVNQQGMATALTDDGYSDITVTEISTGLSAATLISVFNSDLYTSSSPKSSGGSSSTTPKQTVNAETIFEGLDYFAVPSNEPG